MSDDMIAKALALVDKRNKASSAPVDVLANFLKHADSMRTIDDVYSGMTSDQRDLFDTIVGAAVDDEELPDSEDIARIYNTLTDEQIFVLEYVTGLLLADEELEHSGVKGMKWGVRKGEITAISGPKGSKTATTIQKSAADAVRARVKAGDGSLLEAHLAGFKSTGHRVTNALFGDKTYWKRSGVITAAAAATVAGIAAAPGAMPLGVLYAGMAGHNVVMNINSADNLIRAVRGNARISKSLATLTQTDRASLLQPQTSGSKRVQKVLNRNGSIKRKNLAPTPTKSMAQSAFDKVLKHFGIRGMKWGVRRSDGPDGTVSSAPGVKVKGKPSASDDSARAKATLKALQRGGVKSVSNSDLQHLTNRLNLEKKYADVDKSVIGKFDSKVNRLLGYGDTMNKAIIFANSAAGKELNLLLRNKSRGRHASAPMQRLLVKNP